MIKVIAPALRHPTNRTLEDFHRYWGETHGPLFSNTRRLRGYVQHLTLPEAYGAEPAPTYDGVSMFFYDDPGSQGVATNDPEVLQLLSGIFGVPVAPREDIVEGDPADVALLRAVLKDDAQLFDRSTTWPMHHKRATVVAEERVIVDGATTPEMVKAIFIATKLPGLTLLEFFDHWQHTTVLWERRSRACGGTCRTTRSRRPTPAARTRTTDGRRCGSTTSRRCDPRWPRPSGRRWSRTARRSSPSPSASAWRASASRRTRRRWTPNDWGATDMTEEEIRARLAEQGYAALAADPEAPRKIKQAAERDALAVWTEEHLVTLDASGIDARPDDT